MNAIISKSMPRMTGGTADRDSTFVLGRRAFFNNTSKSYESNNVGKNVDYSKVLKKDSSNVYAKPLPNKSGDLRIQRLRLATIGSGSSKLKDNNDFVSFVNDGPDRNLVNSALSRVRGGGAIATRKTNKGRVY